MQRLTSCLLTAGLCASALSAQATSNIPGFVDADPTTTAQENLIKSLTWTTEDKTKNPLTLFDSGAWTSSGRNITQGSLIDGASTLPPIALQNGVQPHLFCCTSSSFDTKYVPAANGGSGDVIIIEVTLDSNGNPVTMKPTDIAADLNSPGNDFGLMLDKTGRYAALDWPQGAMISFRTLALPTSKFHTPVQVSGVGGAYVDPAPGEMNGKLGLFWVSSATTMTWQELSLTMNASQTAITAAAVTGAPVTVITSSNQPHSPTPLFSGFANNNSAQGLWFSRVTGGDSEQYFAGNLDTNEDGGLVHDSTAWSNNGGVLREHFVCAYSGHYNTYFQGRGSYMTSNNNIAVGPNAKLDLTIVSPVGTPNIFTARLAIGLQAPSINVQLGGILGALGFAPAIVAPLPAQGAGEVHAYQFPATDNTLKNLSLYLQAITIPLDNRVAPALTNTLKVNFK